MEGITTIALSSLGIALAQYCKGVADSTSYDEKAEQIYYKKIEANYPLSAELLSYVKPQFTRYHTRGSWDMWHIMSRLSVIICYVTALCAGAYIGISWWLVVCSIANALAGIVGFNLGDRWKGSMWMRYIGRIING